MIRKRVKNSSILDRNSRRERGRYGWFEVPKSLEESLQSRDQRLISCREKGKRKDCLLSLFFFHIILSLFFVFFLWKNLRDKEDGMGGLRHQIPWRRVFYQEIKSWCLVETKGKREDIFLLLFFFLVYFLFILYFYVIKIWERKRDGMVDLCFNELGHGDLILDMI